MAFKLLAKSQMLKHSYLHELMRYSLTPVPSILATADGYFNKTNKDVMRNYFVKQGDNEFTAEYSNEVYLVRDGNAMLHGMVDVPPTFKRIALQLLDTMINQKKFIFSTDC